MIGALLLPARTVIRVIDGIAAIASIEREIRGLRGDMSRVVTGIEGLRDDVRAMHGGVDRIGTSTQALEAKVDGLGVHIDALGSLAGRLGRFGARRREPELG
jgi:hypothetical protein